MKTAAVLEDIYAPIASELEQVPQAIRKILESDNPHIQEVIDYFFSSSGKMLRPAMTLLGAKLIQSEGGRKSLDSGSLIRLAAAFEIFHVATLIHDDIIDSAELRRNQLTIHKKWGADTAVLMGDYLHDRALQTVLEEGGLEIMRLFLTTAGLVCEGELHEVRRKRYLDLTEAEYFEIIRKKTASLLSCALEAGIRKAGRSAEESERAAYFGESFGMAFQIIDDCLDFTGSREEFGKTLGMDFDEGVLTLPMIEWIRQDPSRRRQLESKRSDILNDRNELKKLTEDLVRSGAIDYAFGQAKNFALKASRNLEFFSNSPAKHSLEELVSYVLKRTQ